MATLKTEGIDFKYDPDKVMGDIRKRLLTGFIRAAGLVADMANSLAPFDPQSRHAAGQSNFPPIHHKGSIKPFAKIKKGEIKAGIVSTSGRGWWLESGTVDNPAQPHMKPALDSQRAEILGSLEGIL